MNPDRYSPNLEKRYQTARADYGTELPQRWPMGCVGAPTAFLVLLGPSMGGNRSGEPVAMGGVDRPLGDTMIIGKDVQTFHLRRPTVWKRLCAEIWETKATCLP